METHEDEEYTWTQWLEDSGVKLMAPEEFIDLIPFETFQTPDKKERALFCRYLQAEEEAREEIINRLSFPIHSPQLNAKVLKRLREIEREQEQFSSFILRLEEGRGFQMHTHETDSTIVVLEGECEILLGDTILRVGPGGIIRIPPGKIHCFYKIVRGPVIAMNVHPGELVDKEGNWDIKYLSDEAAKEIKDRIERRKNGEIIVLLTKKTRTETEQAAKQIIKMEGILNAVGPILRDTEREASRRNEKKELKPGDRVTTFTGEYVGRELEVLEIFESSGHRKLRVIHVGNNSEEFLLLDSEVCNWYDFIEACQKYFRT
jgi:quercetin dioxygenase-like cupin family protein